MRTLLVLVLAAAGCADAPAMSGTPPSECNGHAALCARTYDAVTFPGTHDAYANRQADFIAADQSYPLSKQLAAGVRVLHLEIQPNAMDGDRPSLCHASCILGSERLADGLSEVHTFVDAHPAELVTLLMETSNVTTDTVASAIKTSGLYPFLHTQTLDAPWPTLGAMLAKSERVVAFLAADGGGSHPYLLDRWSFTWETPWDNETLDDFERCDADRGVMSNSIYVVDTYLEDLAIETPTDAARVNVNPFLIDRLLLCRDKTKRRPNFAMVNYYEVGDLFTDVDMLNGFVPAPPFDDADFPPDAGAPMADAGTDGGDAGTDAGDAGP